MAQALFDELQWRQDQLLMYGKLQHIPRLQAWYGDLGCDYHYSKLTLAALPWTPLLAKLKTDVSQFCQHEFNGVLANCYRDQHDSVGWHSDDESELGDQPTIASLSFGAERVFYLKHKVTGETFKIPLQSGSLLVMSKQTQKFWWHAVNKMKRQCSMRINLTFRKIY